MNSSFPPTDADGTKLHVGDRVRLLNAPDELLRGLPSADQDAIKRQVGEDLVVQSFDPYGNAELEFKSDDDVVHSIWVNPKCLQKSPKQD